MKTSILGAFLALCASSIAFAQPIDLDNGIPAACDSPMATSIITKTVDSYLDQTNPAVDVVEVMQSAGVPQTDSFSCFVELKLSGTPGIMSGTVQGVMGKDGNLYTRYIDESEGPFPAP